MRDDASPPRSGVAARALSHGLVRFVASAMLFTSTLVAGIALAPLAIADSAGDLRAAVMALRPSCAALRSDPMVEQVAENVNHSTDLWIDYASNAVPVPDPLPVLKDLGYPGNKGVEIVASGRTDAEAIKGLLLQGYLKIPDCSYSDYGVSFTQNQTSGYYLATLVLAGT